MSVFSGCKSQFITITQSWMCVLLLYCFVIQNDQIRFYWTSFNVMTSSCNIDYVAQIRIYFQDAKSNISQNSIMSISLNIQSRRQTTRSKDQQRVPNEKGNTELKLEKNFHEYTGIPRKAVNKYVELWSFWCKVWRPTTRQQENPS